MQSTDPRFKINPNLNLEALGLVINEALFVCGECPDTCRDLLFQANEMIFPDSCRPATPTENAALAAMEPPAGNDYQTAFNSAHAAYLRAGNIDDAQAQATSQPAGIQPYAPLILDESDIPDPQAETSIDKLHQVIDEILDGEKEPAAFLEVLEITWKIAHDCSSAMEKVDAIINQNIALKQQNQQLIGVLNMQAQTDSGGRA